MHTIKHIISAYGKWVWGLLAPLGVWGVFAISAVDAAFMGLPMDAIVASYIYKDPHRFFLYVLLAAAGSALGSVVIYVIGYTGGEVLLRKRLSPARFQKIHASFERHEFLALMLPAMLPPPTPFKAVVLAAAAFEMSFSRFLLAIFAGRFFRFLILGYLTLRLGPQVVEIGGGVIAHHFKWVLIGVGAVAMVWLVWRRQRAEESTVRQKADATESPKQRSERSNPE
ncbi:MAG: TVP38/TMEM64 family protein [Acidobacteria bacterium]|nr:MAG: TVP38/TMEM64 family protein [Acidobacteriota bacterium]